MAAALVWAGLPASAPAMTSSDCVLSIDESSPVRVDPAGSTVFNVRANEGPDPMETCLGAGFQVNKIFDSTLSPGATTPSPGGVSAGTAQPVLVNMPFSGPGAGTVIYEVQCISGCDVSPSPPVTFQVDVKDYQLAYAAPTPGGFATETVNTDVTLGGEIQVDGMPFATSGQVFFQVVSGPATGTFNPAGAMPGTGVVNADGSGGVQIDFQAPVEGTYTIEATGDSSMVPMPRKGGSAKGAFPLFVQVYTVDIRINRTAVINAGDGLSGQPGESVSISVRALDDGAPTTDTIDWSIVSGSGSLAQPSTVTTAGVASNVFSFGASGGPVVIRGARASDPTGFVDFNLENYTYQLSLPNGPNPSGAVNSGIVHEVRLERVGISTNLVPGATLDFAQVGGPGTGFFQPLGGGSPTSSATTDTGGVARLEFVAPVVGNYNTQVNHTPPPTGAPVTGTPMGQSIGLMPMAVVSTPPTFDTSPPTVGAPAEVYRYDFSASDAEMEPITFTASLPSWLSLTDNGDGTGTLLGSPGVADIGAPNTVILRATDQSSAFTEQTFSITVTEQIIRSLQRTSGDGQSAQPGQAVPAPLVVTALNDGIAAPGVPISFTVSPLGAATLSANSTTTGADGSASITATLSASAAGTVQITASRADDPDSSPVTFSITVTAGPVLSLSKPSDSGDGQSSIIGGAFNPLKVVAQNNGAPAPGVGITWVVSGPATLSASRSVTDADGIASIGINPGTVAGTVSVVATREDALSAVTSFVLSVIPRDQPYLELLSGNSQRGVIGTRADAPIVVVQRDASGLPVAGQQIDWTVLTGEALLDNASSVTDAQGMAQIGFRFGNTLGAVQIRASNALLGSSIDSLHSAIGANVQSTSGNGQSGIAGQPLEQPLVVQISPEVAKALSGAIVAWEVIAGGGSLQSNSTTTDDQGRSQNFLTLGPVPGVNTVRATIPGGQEFIFTAQGSDNTAVLSIVSGNSQTLAPNTASAPLAVRLVDAAGQGLSGIALNFVGDNASVADSSVTTDAQGNAQTTAMVLLSGPATVTVSSEAVSVDPVVFQLNGALANLPGLSPDGRDVGGTLDASCDNLQNTPNRTAAQDDLLNRCREFADSSGDNQDEVRNAFDQLPTPVGGGVGQSGQDTIGAQMTNINTRFDMLRYAQSGGAKNSFNVGFWTPDGVIAPNMMSAVGAAEDEQDEVGADFGRWGFFATGTIGRGEYDGTSRRAKFDYDIAGLTAGVDYRFRDNLIGGLAFGYTNNDADLADDLGSLETKGWSTSAYLSWFSERQWYVDSMLSYGRNSYDLQRRLSYSIRSLSGGRTVIDQVATADTDGTQTAASVALGRDFQKGPWTINSYLRGSYARVEYDSYTERMIEGRPGQGLALQVDGRSQNSITSALGARATYVLSRDWGILMPSASLEWQREYEDDPTRVTARFAADPNGPSFVDIGDDIDNSYFNVGVGVSALFPGGKTAYLYYEELVGASRLRQGVLSLGVRVEF
ncbi:autotransporter domain-containing protein [Pseudomarimonas arenosa]|uniref:Autotransporter domain-containing protein n=1 Tax=Pseudomarimonas arenosa TaxID=2774145 RepID=A0AAW3ZLV0_9GAMM|nr:autotransporter domain-containing protein [Pseudomarimonas arenosa]MBD8526037.1 autotransporter domain-containing protein [Pseudomarimonas arenosa]